MIQRICLSQRMHMGRQQIETLYCYCIIIIFHYCSTIIVVFCYHVMSKDSQSSKGNRLPEVNRQGGCDV